MTKIIAGVVVLVVVAAFTLTLPRQGTAPQDRGLPWGRQLGTAADESANAIARDSSGNLYVAGTTDGVIAGSNNKSRDIFIAKYDVAGNQAWIVQYGSTSEDRLCDISIGMDGSVYLVGATSGVLGVNNEGSDDAFLMKLSPTNGAMLWTKQFGSADADEARSVAVDSQDNIYVVGETDGALVAGLGDERANDAFVARYNASGQRIWIKQLGNDHLDGADCVAVDALGNVYVGGDTTSLFPPALGDLDAFIAKLNPQDGSLIWGRQFGGANQDGVADIAIAASGDIIVGGTMDIDDLPGPGSGYVSRWDSNGNSLWIRRQNDNAANDFTTGVSVDSSGNTVVCGTTDGDIFGHTTDLWSIFMAKYDSSGKIIWSSQFGPRDSSSSGIEVASDGSVYIAGSTAGNLYGTCAGGYDAFISRIPRFAAPTFLPGGGTYSAKQIVTISSNTTAATIRYTTDGTEPSATSAVYTGAITVDRSMTLKARAWKTGYVASDVGKAAYLLR